MQYPFPSAFAFAASEFGLFLSDDDNKQGVWLESGRNLGYYLLRNHDVLEYRRKLRTIRVRMLDGAVKTILVDDSQPVSQLMVVICTKIGITNHEEYGLVREENDQQNENLPDNKTGTLTLRRKFAEKDRDAKMESLRKKLKTDDESKCAGTSHISGCWVFLSDKNWRNKIVQLAQSRGDIQLLIYVKQFLFDKQIWLIAF